MTVLALNLLWVNRLDTGEAVAAKSDPSDRGQQHTRQVSVREYANGRVRSVASPGMHAQLRWKLVAVDTVVKDTLVSWQGIPVQVRDYRDQKFFGVFDSVDVSEFEQPSLYNAGFTLSTVTVVEGV